VGKCVCVHVCVYVSVCATLVPCYLLVGEDYRVAAFVTCVREFECVYVYERACAPHVCVYVVCARMCVCVRAPLAHVHICAVSSELRTRQTKCVRPSAVAPSESAACAAALRVRVSEHSRVCICRVVTLPVYLYVPIIPVSMRAFAICVYECVFICEGMCSACMRTYMIASCVCPVGALSA
jgi:hypothetical protein